MLTINDDGTVNDGDHFLYPPQRRLRYDPTSRLGLPTPWGQAAFTDEQVAEIHALIPDGLRIVVTAWNGKAGIYNVRAYDRQGNNVSTFEGQRDAYGAARKMARVLQAEAVA